jgi:hypothetical protein
MATGADRGFGNGMAGVLVRNFERIVKILDRGKSKPPTQIPNVVLPRLQPTACITGQAAGS